ncbi:zinc finger protein 728-like [Belonocnema kinseyi]|uniref:zinc finger protein 728-like n=1 Tax=Belonocnema kinseyi TaxID=2817044 RepID=UPI00143D8650|nr:zinc finger protein 728-like [Belonocnema kinseyi]
MLLIPAQTGYSHKSYQQNSKTDSRKSTETLDCGPYSCTPTPISSGKKSGAETLQYDIHDPLEIKEEIIQDPEPITVHEGNKSNESKFCTIYVRDDILAVKSKPQTMEKQKIQESEQEKKYACEKCARSYKYKRHLHRHKKFECDVKPQFQCEFCNKRFAHKRGMLCHYKAVQGGEEGKRFVVSGATPQQRRSVCKKQAVPSTVDHVFCFSSLSCQCFDQAQLCLYVTKCRKTSCKNVAEKQKEAFNNCT